MNAKQGISFLALTFIWGTSFYWIKIAVRETGPIMVVTLRLSIALLTLLAVMAVRRPEPPGRKNIWGPLFIQGMFISVIPWTLITWAEQHIASAQATVLNATVPLFTVLVSAILLKDDRMTWKQNLGLFLGFLGVIIIVHEDFLTQGSISGNSSIRLGQIAMVLSSISYAVGNVFPRLKLRGLSPLVQAFYSVLFACLFMWPVSLTISSPLVFPTKLITWVAIGWLGALSTGLSLLLFYYLLHSIGPTRVSTIAYSLAVVGIMMGALFLDEKLGMALIGGTVLVFLSVWIVNRKKRKSGETPPI